VKDHALSDILVEILLMIERLPSACLAHNTLPHTHTIWPH